MSSDLERRIREARAALPEPDAEATRRAHARALGAVRRRRPRVRLAILAGVVFGIALALGAGLGTLIPPSGTAARGPVGLGFLPEPGWFALQSGSRAMRGQPAVAIAANVPFDPDDDVRGLAESSGLPYSTLLGLPPHGIVIVATFTPYREQFWAGSRFAREKLPLRVRDAVPYIQYGAQVRPEEPLGQYQLRAAVDEYNVDVNIYFGSLSPSSALRTEAQRQLDQLVVRSPHPRRPAATSEASTLSGGAIDRTLLCATAPTGGIYEIEARAHRGIREGPSRWKQLPFAVVGSGGTAGRANTPELFDNSLAWISAARATATTTVDTEFMAVPVSALGTLAVKAGCRTTTTPVPLTPAGLEGGAASPFGDELDCSSPRRVLVRVRAVLGAPTSLRKRGMVLKTTVPVKEARLTIRTQTGKPLVYAEVFESGKARLFTAKGCVPD